MVKDKLNQKEIDILETALSCLYYNSITEGK